MVDRRQAFNLRNCRDEELVIFLNAGVSLQNICHVKNDIKSSFEIVPCNSKPDKKPDEAN